MRKALGILLLLMYASAAKAETYRFKYNPHTGKQDYVNVVTSDTLPGGSTQYLAAFPILDEGVLQGNATSFNFIGSNINCTVTGSIADCTVTGGVGGGGGSLSVKDGSSFVSVSSAIAAGNQEFQLINGTWVLKVNLSTLTTRADNLDISTMALQSQIYNIRSSNVVNGLDPAFALFVTTGEAGIRSGSGFALFLSSGEAGIRSGSGFSVFIGTGQPKIEAAGGWTLAKSTVEAGVRSGSGFDLFLATGQPQISAAGGWTLAKSTVEAGVRSGSGFANFLSTGQAAIVNGAGFKAYIATFPSSELLAGSGTIKGDFTISTGSLITSATPFFQSSTFSLASQIYLFPSTAPETAGDQLTYDSATGILKKLVWGRPGGSVSGGPESDPAFTLFATTGQAAIRSGTGFKEFESTGTAGIRSGSGFNQFTTTGQQAITDAAGWNLAKSTAEAAIRSGTGFNQFTSTGQAAIRSGTGFNQFTSTGQQAITDAAGWNLAKSTVEAGVRSGSGFNEFRSTGEARLDLFVSTMQFLQDPAHVINQSSNNISWNVLKDVPAGFADGTDASGAEGSEVAFAAFVSTGEAAIRSGTGFKEFESTGTAGIRSGSGFNEFQSTGQPQISAAGGWTLAKSTVESGVRSGSGFNEFTSTGHVSIQNGAGFKQFISTLATAEVVHGSMTLRGALTTTGPVIAGDLSAWTTSYTPFEFPFYVRYATAIARSTDTVGPSHVLLEANLSTGSQEAMFSIDIPPGVDSSFDPQLLYAITASTGVDPGSHTFSVAVASVGVPSVANMSIDNVVWKSTFVVQTTSTTGVASLPKITPSSVYLLNWKDVSQTGTRKLYIKLTNISLANSTCRRWFQGGLIAWRRRI